MKAEWVDTRDCEPLEDGVYLTQTIFGNLNGYNYTLDGGWNTFYTKKGELVDDSAFNDGYVVRWLSVGKPSEVPAEWEEEYMDKWRKENA